MTKKVTIILPAGEAVWPKLNEVDVYQPTDKKGRPNGAEKRRYITRVKYNDDNFRKVDDFLKEQLVKFDLEDGKLPWKKDKKTGLLSLEATSGEKYRPAVFDAKGNKVPAKVIIGGGSILKLDVTVNPYTGFGGGINLYMNAVQLLKLVQREENRFEAEEEGYTFDGSDEDSENASPFGAEGSDEADEDF
jgi:hypothetical protein